MNATASTPQTCAWEARAKELLALEWGRIMNGGGDAVVGGGNAVDHEPFIAGPIAWMWIVPDLLDLVARNHDQPVIHLAPQVQHMLTEANFVEECGDGVPPFSAKEIERQTERIVEVLEKVREAALADSRWSDAPVTPIMFG